MIAAIEGAAERILEQSPGVVVRFRLLRDVLRSPRGDPALQSARANLDESQNIQELAAAQQEDGGWGRFHSGSARLKGKISSTEVGVERALALGLDAKHPVLEKASNYILNIMDGRIAFPDYHEKNDRWETGMRLFLASTLSLIQPDHPVLASDRYLWRAIAEVAFQSGEYNQVDEIKAHAEMTGATVKDSYLVLNGRYQLAVLGSVPGTLSGELETVLLGWLWKRPDGIGYLGIPLNREPLRKPGPFDRWLASLELLARSFPAWVKFAGPSIALLWARQGESGYWDFGPRPGSIANLPISDHWRRKSNRRFDWTTRVLVLLRRYYEDSQ